MTTPLRIARGGARALYASEMQCKMPATFAHGLPLPQKSFFLVGPRATSKIARAYGIYRGRDVLRDGPVEILPLPEFQRRLSAGRILVV